MRILHAHTETRAVGGTETYLHALAEAQRAAGHEVLLAHRGTAPAEAAAYAPDVVHIHRSPFAPAVEAGLARRARVVRSLHDFSFGCAAGHKWFRDGSPCTRAHGPGCLAGILARGCAHRRDLRPLVAEYRAVGERLATARAADAVVVHSEHVREVAVANGIDAARCRVLPYFVSLPERAPPLPVRRTVAFVGRVELDKGLDVLIEALASVPEAWDELLVAGDGADRARCGRVVAKTGVGERTTFLGWTGREGVEQALREARVVALPSRWPEPFGIVGLEAGAFGRPVVASAAGGIPEWLEDGRNGLLVPPGDRRALAAALAAVLDDASLAEDLGAEGRRRAAGFSVARHLAALDDVYRDVLAEDRRAA